MKKVYRSVFWILGDQLDSDHSWFENTDNNRLFVIAELKQEASYCHHHVQKVAAFFTSMKTFADALRNSGHHVLYLTLDDTAGFEHLPNLIAHTMSKFSATQFNYQRPDEYRLLMDMRSLSVKMDFEIKECDTEHFLFPYDQIASDFVCGKAHRMESFYRKMRKKFDILMKGDKPVGGTWNYDKENREKLKKNDLTGIPSPIVCIGTSCTSIEMCLSKTLAPILYLKAGIEKQRTNVAQCFRRPKRLSILLKRYRDFSL